MQKKNHKQSVRGNQSAIARRGQASSLTALN